MKLGFLREVRVRQKSEKGMSLIELMIAMLVLAVGLGAITILLTGSIASDNRSSKDSTATMLAQMVIEQISAQHVYSSATITITDCDGTAWTVATAPGASPSGAGATLLVDRPNRPDAGLQHHYRELRHDVCGLRHRWSENDLRRSLERDERINEHFHATDHRVRASHGFQSKPARQPILRFAR